VRASESFLEACMLLIWNFSCHQVAVTCSSRRQCLSSQLGR
jgi:hypothetical protein